MEVVRELRKVKGKELTITLPDDFMGTEVEILILPLNRDSSASTKNKAKEIEEDIIEAMNEVKMMREGKLPEKSARELLNEL